MDRREQEILRRLLQTDGVGRVRGRKVDSLWKRQIDVPFNLIDALSGNTVSELNIIKHNLDIQLPTTLKKQQLIERLAVLTPEYLIPTMQKLDQTRYQLIRKVMQAGGAVSSVSMDVDHFLYLKDLGILYSGTCKDATVFAMPAEIALAMQQVDHAAIQPILDRNTEWIKLTQGALYYYGVMSLPQLEKVIEQHTGEPVDREAYLQIMEEASRFYEQIEPIDSGFAHSEVQDIKAIRKEQRSRNDLDYYPYTKAQLLKAGEPDYFERNASYKALANFVRQYYDVDKQELDFLIEECIYSILNDDPIVEVFGILEESLQMDSEELVDAFMSLLVSLSNTIPKWVLKGHSSEGLSGGRNIQPSTSPKAQIYAFHTGQKVGRNDPCPCGSGKKFKKCCGS